jgi:hypothetical protein
VLLHSGPGRPAGAVGLAALTGYLDYVLIPALVVFIGLTLDAVGRQRRAVTK